jgi:hypothetical protein
LLKRIYEFSLPLQIHSLVNTGIPVQSFANSHWHYIIMEGGVYDKMNSIRIKDIAVLTEVFRKAVIKLFVDKEMIKKLRIKYWQVICLI